MRVTMIGSGYVGLVTGACLAEIGNDVVCVDSNQEKIRVLQGGGVPIYEPGLEDLLRRNREAGRIRFTDSLEEGVRHGQVIFIGVNTPPRPDGTADLSFVETVARQVADAMTEYKIIVDKSTVPVHTGDKVAETIKRYNSRNVDFDIVSNPEFLREGSAIHDFMEPDRIVIGVTSERPVGKMRALYSSINAPILVTNVKSAELIKHASNSFLALKISYANALARICDLAGADVEEVVEGMGMDPRIGRAFLNAGLGYGGSCFPKDVSAFIKIAEEIGYDFKLLEAVQEINTEQVRYFCKKVEEILWVVKGKKVGVLGLAFKPNTDDMRNAPSIPIIQWMLSDGATVQAYDPQAMDVTRKILPGITYCRNAYEAAAGCDALLLLTEWDEFQSLDMTRIKQAMRLPLLIDGRNAFDPEEMARLGFTYRGIGRAHKEK